MFSVVVPVYNMADTIGLCLDSLGKLTFPSDKFEVIVVDNGSDDGTEVLIKNYPFKIMKETEFQSAYASRNTAIRAAAGQFIAFTDADCIVDPDWLSEIARHTDDQSIGCFAGEILSYPPNSTIERFSEHIGLLRQKGPLSGWHHRPYAQTANAIYRADVFRVAGLFHPMMKSGGDADIAWRMQDRAKLGLKFVPEAKVFHRHRIDFPTLYGQFRRYGTGKISWAQHHADYKPPPPSKFENDVIKAFTAALIELETANLPEEQVIFPVLRSFTQAAHYVGYLQNLATLGARVDRQDGLPTIAVANSPRCAVCYGTTFKPGPNKRLNRGRPPMCADCGGLERHRIMASILRLAPLGLTAGKRHLIVGETLGIRAHPFGEQVQTKFQKGVLVQQDAAFDWVTTLNALQFEEDDRAAMSEILRCSVGGGIVQVHAAGVAARFQTETLERKGAKDAYRAYGLDFSAKLSAWFPQLRALAVSAIDPATGEREIVHMLSSNLAALAMIDRDLKRNPEITTVLL